jgi:hypothetical protein
MLDDNFNLESLGSFDCRNEVFHPVCVIESGFQCLYITKEILPELYSSGPKRQSPKNLVNGADAAPEIPRKLGKEADTALGINNVLISEHVLSRMEENWTNNARPYRSNDTLESNLFATIIYQTTISRNCELKRYISCLVFDE